MEILRLREEESACLCLVWVNAEDFQQRGFATTDLPLSAYRENQPSIIPTGSLDDRIPALSEGSAKGQADWPRRAREGKQGYS